jgi:uncharacterized protein (TIGR00255 family)
MTGFGRGTSAGPNFSVTIDLKTVNNRFLDVNLRIASEMQHLESDLKRAISGRLSRGRVDVTLQFERGEDVSYEINRPLIKGYLSAIKEIQQEFELAGDPDLNSIIRLPNVLLTKKEDIGDAFAEGVKSALEAALDDLERMRELEGSLLHDELESRLAGIEARLPAIEKESSNVAEEYRERLTKRIGEMLAKSESQIEIDQSRLAQEVAYLADRADISEEIMRLRSHIEHFRTITGEEKEVGKRLDFLTQELNREANTVTSKSNNMIVKENALAIKSEIEKIREQVQNVE